MAENQRLTSFEDLPSHLILEVLVSGGLSVMDLVNIELTSKVFGFEASLEFNSVADQAAFQLCSMHPAFVSMSMYHKNGLFQRCTRNWKRVLRFLVSIAGSCDAADTSKGKVQIVSGYNYSVINNSMVYSCGSNALGDFAYGPMGLPLARQVFQGSARDNNVAYVTHSGEVFTCGRLEFGLVNINHPIYKPNLVEALKNIPCKQVEIGMDFTVFLTREGNVYTVGRNGYGQLGHGDTMTRQVPKMVEGLEKIVQISAGPFYVLALAENGYVYFFGDITGVCLGDRSFKNKLKPQIIQTFKSKGAHILSVSAGVHHATAIDSNGYVYRWGQRNLRVRGFGDPDMILLHLENQLAVQVCAANMKTYVVVESGLVYRFEW